MSLSKSTKQTHGDPMKRYTPAELADVLAAHKKWLLDQKGGSRADLSRADLSGADLNGADLSRADLRGADLNGAYLRRAYLSGADLSGADLSGAYLRRAYLRWADLNGADLSRADLRGADLSGADLSGADLRGADLNGAYLRRAYLSGADLSGADLSGADLRWADLRWAYLSGADLRRAGKIADLAVFTGLYQYQCWAVVTEAGVPWVRMGCLWKSLEEWTSNGGIRPSNPGEFPDDGSEKCEQRVRAFDFTRTEAERMAAKWAAENPAQATA
jgi:uncharacterized protein YjbI with pentapeptide repeats